MIFPDMARVLPGTASDSAPDWLMKRQPGSLELFCFPLSCIKIHATIAWVPGLKKRLGHALIRPVLAHKDSGGRAFNWSGILGSIATSSLSNAYYPEGNRGVGATFSRIAMSIPSSMIDEVVNEFGPDLEKKIVGKNENPQADRLGT